jgi:hypothetical protein
MNHVTRPYREFRYKAATGVAVLGLFGLAVMIVTTVLVGVVMMLLAR